MHSFIGRVVSVANSKTAKVRVERFVLNTLYLRRVKRFTHLMCHDPAEVCVLNDVVRIAPCTPVSSRKNHVVVDIVKPAPRYIDPVTNNIVT